jgi:hypothetical protein
MVIQKMYFIGGVLPRFMFATFPDTLFMKTLFLALFLSIFSLRCGLSSWIPMKKEWFWRDPECLAAKLMIRN